MLYPRIVLMCESICVPAGSNLPSMILRIWTWGRLRARSATVHLRDMLKLSNTIVKVLRQSATFASTTLSAKHCGARTFWMIGCSLLTGIQRNSMHPDLSPTTSAQFSACTTQLRLLRSIVVVCI